MSIFEDLVWWLFGAVAFAAAGAAVGVPLWWLIRSITSRRRPTRGDWAAYLGVVTALTACAGVCWLSAFMLSPFNWRSFDRQAWHTTVPDVECVRGGMAGDILRRHLKEGMSRAEVVRLLGKPSSIEKTPKAWIPPNDHRFQAAVEVHHYGLGACSGFRMDGDFLAVAFDREGKVIGGWTWQS